MTIPKQEDRFEYKGFPCVVLFMPIGYRCGYVGVPKENKIDLDSIDCHGGITYSSNNLHNQNDIDKFWVGFDCGHCFDGFDVSKAKEYYADDENAMKQINTMEMIGYYSICDKEDTVRDLAYVKDQCVKIVDQVIDQKTGGIKMNYYNVKYLKNGNPQGRPYAFKTELELIEGDKLELEGGQHGVIVGAADMEVVERYGADKLKSIIKKCEDESEEE